LMEMTGAVGDAAASAGVEDGFAVFGFPEFVRSGDGFCGDASLGLEGEELTDPVVAGVAAALTRPGVALASVEFATAECCTLGEEVCWVEFCDAEFCPLDFEGARFCELDKLGSCCVVRVVDVAGFWGSVGEVAARAAADCDACGVRT